MSKLEIKGVVAPLFQYTQYRKGIKVMSKLEKINKALDKFNNFMLPVVGVLFLINAFLWLLTKLLGK
ncbi:hypothetical protein [Ligilactobacillus murinus]|uniref:hypothetical protein n=1 Tax=Ligilactobacillus murinus TaxID=1622 RepID=UPI0012982FA8|nr:hypothetical protein [Ligilactobacillus murinus]